MPAIYVSNPDFASDWEVTIREEEPDDSRNQILIYAELTRQLPYRDRSLIGREFHNVYGKICAVPDARRAELGKEYRFPRIIIHQVMFGRGRKIPELSAESVGEFYPATPFDPFLIAVEERGDLTPIGALLDKIEEDLGEKPLYTVMGETFTVDELRILRYVFNHYKVDRIKSVRNTLTAWFGGSRQLPPPPASTDEED